MFLDFLRKRVRNLAKLSQATADWSNFFRRRKRLLAKLKQKTADLRRARVESDHYQSELLRIAKRRAQKNDVALRNARFNLELDERSANREIQLRMSDRLPYG